MTRASTLEWERLVDSFQVMSAEDCLSATAMERHQELRGRLQWLSRRDQPFLLLFVSHRWETPVHPDPSGRQLRVIQAFLRRLALAVEALLVGREERLRLLPRLNAEGSLQAEEAARRMLGFGPFAEDAEAMPSEETKRRLVAAHSECGDGAAFRKWLLARVGIWIDYMCMPQRPLIGAEEAEFGRAIRNLHALIGSATVLALRERGDDYPTRGWCASEFHLASRGSFARALFLDQNRLENGEDVELPSVPGKDQRDAYVKEVMSGAYAHDSQEFQQACDEWITYQGIFARHRPPDAWAAYRSLQGSGFYASSFDPNPGRRAFDFVRGTEEQILRDWLPAETEMTIDIDQRIARGLIANDLSCLRPEDLPYVGYLLLSNTRAEPLRSLFVVALDRHLSGKPCVATLYPPWPEIGTLLKGIRPVEFLDWISFSTLRDPRARALKAALAAHPPRFEFN